MASQMYTPKVVEAEGATPALHVAEDEESKIVREDGRSCDTFRPIRAYLACSGDQPDVRDADDAHVVLVVGGADIRTGQHSQASGSSYVQVGGTKVVCSVYGPRSFSRASAEFSAKCVLTFDVKFAPFASAGERRERGQQDDERELSLLLGQVLSASVRREKYPKSSVDVFVMVVEDDGGALPAAITAASLAFADAGIELLDIVTACSTASFRDKLVLDPTVSEQAVCSSSTTMASMCSLGEVTYAWHAGVMSVRQVTEAMSLCLDGCNTLYKLARQQLLDGTRQKAKRLGREKQGQDKK